MGSWLEYDSIGSDWTPDEFFLENIPRLIEADFGDQILLSHDRGWFDPSLPGGGDPKPFTYLSNDFLPKLREIGIDETTIEKLTVTNPFLAFSR
jgi:phosphotriesterase-related protein